MAIAFLFFFYNIQKMHFDPNWLNEAKMMKTGAIIQAITMEMLWTRLEKNNWIENLKS